MFGCNRIENTYIVLPYCRISEVSNKVGRIDDNFRALARKLSFFPTELDFFLYTITLCMYSNYLSTFNLFSFIISNTDKHEFSSKRKLICCFNDVMNHFDCVIKRGVHLQKMHSCSKTIRGISFFCSKNIRGISRKNIS